MSCLSPLDIQENHLLPELQLDCLRFVTCGSVDAGKSTLIGRLLYDSQLLYDDQIDTLEKDTKKYSTPSGEQNIDFSLLLDGLQDEREQGITIDLAYRFFQLGTRRFIVADAPGHEQYTKNMAAGASNSSLGVIVIDGEKGILPQTKRHTYILYLMGIRHFVLCVNKMDAINFSEMAFKKITYDYKKLIQSFESPEKQLSLYCIPVSAAQGDNVTRKGDNMPWYNGTSLLTYLQTVQVDIERKTDFIMPVQLVNRFTSNVRGYMGTVIGGEITVGDNVRILPSNQTCTIKGIIADNKNKNNVSSNESITLVLDRDIDIVRGDLIVKENSLIKSANQFHVNLFCLEEEPLYSSRSYIFKFAHKTVTGTISSFKGKYDLTSLTQIPTHCLSLNEFGEGNIHLSQKIPFKPYELNKTLGSFLIIDRITKATVGIGMVLFDLNRSHNISTSKEKVDKTLRSKLKAQKPCVLWFTGLSGSGKSTIANLVEEKLFDKGYHTYLIDGDNLRKGLSADLGFTKSDRIENMRRIGFLSKSFVDAGLITLVATISPFQNERENIRESFESNEFIEVYVKTSLETCINRDPKKIYAKHKAGEFSNLTGVDSLYEPPVNPEIILDTETSNPEDLAEQIIEYVLKIQP
jgi:bifunctional enzyme CysN/CysC